MNEIYSLGKYRDVVEAALNRASRESWVRRIWAREAALWKTDPVHVKIIENSLGWLTVADELGAKTAEIRAFADEVRGKGFTSACLLGMGGSSLCPEVCALTFGRKTGFLSLTVLDTTDPAGISTAEKSMDPERTLFIVASKSGGTIESASLQQYFYAKLKKLKGPAAGQNFIAITDPGTSLEKLGRELAFRRVFLNMKDIGGRYSALSYFGLVPMALIGLDVDEILRRARDEMKRCRNEANPAANEGLRLGATLGALAHAGRDKVTFVLPTEIEAFGFWIEQLVAESTGKEGVGILPVEGETLSARDVYREDRVFVRIGLEGREDAAVDGRLRALQEAGHPVLGWTLRDKEDLGGEMFRWEFATAVAGAVLGINPFDQPNVQESKDNSQRVIRQYRETGRFDESGPLAGDGPLSLFCAPSLAEQLGIKRSGHPSLGSVLKEFFKMTRPHDYVALLAYIERSEANHESLQVVREKLRDSLRAATTVGFGPRFLHSTGQLHKGGANNGVFLQITARDQTDLEIPDAGYTFGALKRAQVIGDMEALVKHGRRALRLHIDGDTPGGLDELARIAESI